MKTKNADFREVASFFLRLALAVPFLYAAIAAMLQPDSWVGFFPVWLRSIIPSGILLGAFSLYQFGLTAWLLSGKKSYYAALLSAATLVAIIIANLSLLDIVFRDIGLLLAAVALALLHKDRK